MNLNKTAVDNRASSLVFTPPSKAASPWPTCTEAIVVGRLSFLTSTSVLAALFPTLSAETTSLSLSDNAFVNFSKAIIDAMLQSIKGSGKITAFLPPLYGENGHLNGDNGDTKASATKLSLIAPPPDDEISRNNHLFSPHFISDMLVECLGGSGMSPSSFVQIYVIDSQAEEFMCCVAAAVARALPLYNSKSAKGSDDPATAEMPRAGTAVSFYDEGGNPIDDASPKWKTARAAADGVRLAARLGDMPPAELDPAAYAGECESVRDGLRAGGADVTYREIAGEELRERGYGGIYGVGMAARCPPRMIVMTYTPDGSYHEHIALCGKGVCYDTGGLSLKPKIGMCGMKHDMGGSADLLGAFQAAVRLKLQRKITLILAIVENAIGPDSVRNDDILTMKSGKTVEVNNTDAEGRLCLADCVSHASNCLGPVDIILDMATLTGAVSVTTGQKHAGVLAKTQAMEERIFEAGLMTGDLVFPMIYAPELLKSEFASKVADMKNSVKDRSNAQASCAGHFIESHIDEKYEGDWVHVDMAGPDSKNERATGYGVALILGLLEAPGFC